MLQPETIELNCRTYKQIKFEDNKKLAEDLKAFREGNNQKCCRVVKYFDIKQVKGKKLRAIPHKGIEKRC